MNTVAFSINNDWGSGFTGGMSIRNGGTNSLKQWTLEFEAPFEITNIWNAEIVSKTGNRYVIRNVSWNSNISPGQSISFGFNGSKANGTTVKPTNYILNGQSLGSSTPIPTPTPTPAPTPTPVPTPIALPTFSIDDFSIKEGNLNTNTNAAFTVKLSQASSRPVTVNYSTADGTAKSGSDYVATSGRLTFAPGETSKKIAVTIKGDSTVESNESFKLNLTSPTNATIRDGQAIATILNDDVAATPTPTPAPTPAPTPTAGTPNYGEALQKSLLFYEAQRSGVLPNDNRIEWRGNSALKDGADVGVDLTGGYYDAGDHVKFGFPMAGSMTLLSWGVIEYRESYQKSGQLDEALDAIRWGTDYILKAHVTDSNGTKAFWGQVGRGDLDHSYWGSAENMTMQRPAYKIDRQNPGSDLAGEAAAALASASIVFRSSDPAYADRLLKNAVQLFQFADTYRGKYSDSIRDAATYYNSWSGYNDELVWGATWLYKATGDKSYLNKAESYYQGVNAGWTHNWDNKSHGAAILLAQETGNAKYRTDVEGWLNNWTNKSGGIKYTEGGMAWLDQWGSLRYSANTAFLSGIYSDTVNNGGGRYSNFTEDQVDYILGVNPNQRSYMVGFGNNSPKNPHHRGASGTTNISDPAANRNILYGALVGGPSAPNDNAYTDVRTDYISNEVALDYNAALTGALARMYGNFGGNPLSDTQLNSLPGIEVNNGI
ncbi:MAG: hypothetical protein HC879_02005 [Leptolyngbyaceae cyanobacterium SL_5_9]|nr:hypothetical protein [Leptolyngbyaceae cyanobacterium SL_5_9]NJO73860.1 hypothetical protein [Leptolyngbyaceae cyanobacterium RM1_406_9]